MCYPTTCRTCGKTTWAGCGQHVASVRSGVPAAQWCTCDRTATPSPSFGDVLRRLFKR